MLYKFINYTGKKKKKRSFRLYTQVEHKPVFTYLHILRIVVIKHKLKTSFQNKVPYKIHIFSKK